MNSFERLLMKRANEIGGREEVLAYLEYLKGKYYLQNAEPERALEHLSRTSKKWLDQPENEVSARVFSNNIKECFDCPEDSIMVDSVFLAPSFSFIENKLGIVELCEDLIELGNITTSETEWKKKLAHYLLGNFYFNISNTGYFRGFLEATSNCCDYNYFTGANEAASLINNRKGYNLYSIAEHFKTNYRLHTVSMNHYEQTLSLSEDRELNARCLYMMAKCELNKMYNEKIEYGFYDGKLGKRELQYKTSFNRIEEEYQNTAFYAMIIKECSFFRYYTSR